MLEKQNLDTIFNTSFKEDGSNYKALCPMHTERTPSFYIHKDSGLYHCFGCQIGGYIVDLVKEYKCVDTREAENMLGLTFQSSLESEMFNPVIKKAPQPYPESWLAPFKKEIHKYVLGRGLTPKTIGEAEGLYDLHSKRQVFPHRNRDGQLVGAIGRACQGQDPKWWFYWGYQKGRHLYQVPSTKSRTFQEEVWVVEGVFDALWLHQHGYNAVATLGSRPTSDQLDQIKDLSDTIILAYDNDEAGLAGRRYLYEKLHRNKKCLLTLWPRWKMDIMDIDPRELDLYNVVQGELIRSPERSRVILNF